MASAPEKVQTVPSSWARDPVKAAAEEEDMSSSFVERILATEKPLPPVRWSNVCLLYTSDAADE